jgi:hypothetical protein
MTTSLSLSILATRLGRRDAGRPDHGITKSDEVYLAWLREQGGLADEVAA